MDPGRCLFDWLRVFGGCILGENLFDEFALDHGDRPGNKHGKEGEIDQNIQLQHKQQRNQNSLRQMRNGK